ncbi:MAG: hypothetical protein J7L23_02780 [Candidatus Diapherotrites archaeon]|nr:hypothetical protein [Candidatus Diapherotrites archaeon]
MKSIMEATIRIGITLVGFLFLLAVAVFVTKPDGAAVVTARAISNLGPGNLYGLLFSLVLLALVATFVMGWRMHEEARKSA